MTRFGSDPVGQRANRTVSNLSPLAEGRGELVFYQLGKFSHGDVVRLMLATDTGPVRQRLERLLADPRAEASTRQGLDYLAELFGAPRRQGVAMAIDALGAEVDADQIRALAPAYVTALQRGRRS